MNLLFLNIVFAFTIGKIYTFDPVSEINYLFGHGDKTNMKSKRTNKINFEINPNSTDYDYSNQPYLRWKKKFLRNPIILKEMIKTYTHMRRNEVYSNYKIHSQMPDFLLKGVTNDSPKKIAKINLQKFLVNKHTNKNKIPVSNLEAYEDSLRKKYEEAHPQENRVNDDQSDQEKKNKLAEKGGITKTASIIENQKQKNPFKIPEVDLTTHLFSISKKPKKQSIYQEKSYTPPTTVYEAEPIQQDSSNLNQLQIQSPQNSNQLNPYPPNTPIMQNPNQNSDPVSQANLPGYNANIYGYLMSSSNAFIAPQNNQGSQIPENLMNSQQRQIPNQIQINKNPQEIYSEINVKNLGTNFVGNPKDNSDEEPSDDEIDEREEKRNSNKKKIESLKKILASKDNYAKDKRKVKKAMQEDKNDERSKHSEDGLTNDEESNPQKEYEQKILSIKSGLNENSKNFKKHKEESTSLNELGLDPNFDSDSDSEFGSDDQESKRKHHKKRNVENWEKSNDDNDDDDNVKVIKVSANKESPAAREYSEYPEEDNNDEDLSKMIFFKKRKENESNQKMNVKEKGDVIVVSSPKSQSSGNNNPRYQDKRQLQESENIDNSKMENTQNAPKKKKTIIIIH